MQCLLKDRLDPISYFDDRFIFYKVSVISLTNKELNSTTEANRCGNPVNPILQELIALRFYVDESIHRTVTNVLNVGGLSWWLADVGLPFIDDFPLTRSTYF